MTAIAAGVPQPERVVGMHFFNPVPLMRLVEVIAGMNSAPGSARDRARGRRGDGPRVDRRQRRPGLPGQPLQPPVPARGAAAADEGVADAATIDRVVRLGGGFRMGPFELSDLVGVDVGYDIAKSFYELGHGEPRWRPSLIPPQMIAAGRLGRKSGRGYYEYAGGRRLPRRRPVAAA